MDGYRRLVGWAAIAAWMAVGSIGCSWLPRSQAPWSAPTVLPPSPTLEQVITAVNANSQRIQSFSTDQATLSGSGFPTLRAAVAFERPRGFRLRADAPFTGGPEVDLGSNNDVFWLWVKRNQPPAMYFCRHDQFPMSPARRSIPVEPTWLIEALGVADFDPALPHQGPYPTSDGKVQIRTIRETPDGPTAKITVVDARRALVLGQYVYDSRGQLIGSAVASQHRQDPLSGLIMPRIVDVSCPGVQFSIRIDLGNVTVNRLPADPAQLFTMPSYEGYPTVDLGNPNPQMSQAR